MNRMFVRVIAVLLLVAGAFGQQAITGGFEISGMVADAASGQPLDLVTVAVAPVTNRLSFKLVRTGKDGQFLFQGLAKGKYTLTAQRRGYLTQSFDQHAQYSTSIAVGPGLDAHRLVFRLRTESSIEGRIVDEAGEPVRKAQVGLFQATTAGDVQTIARRLAGLSDDEGKYHFGHLPPGQYWISVSAEPWYAQHTAPGGLMQLKGGAADAASAQQPIGAAQSPLDVVYPTVFYPGVADAASAGAIELKPGEKFEGDFVLQPVPAVHVRLTVGGPDSKTHYSANLRQRVAGVQFTDTSVTTSEVSPGVIEISGLAPGRYVMNTNTWTETQGTSVSLSGSEKEITIGATGNVELAAEPQKAPVNGTVTFDSEEKDKKFPANAFIYLRNRKTGQSLYAALSDKGEFELKPGVPAGEWDVTVSNIRDAFVSSVSATGAKVTGQTMQITGKTAVTASVAITRGVGIVEGTALLDGKLLAGAMIVLLPDDPGHNSGRFRRDQSDSDGTFTLSSVVPGKYTVLAIQNGWELDFHDPSVLKMYMAQGIAVQVAANGKYNIKVKIQPVASQ
jgi:protocatechuate 3,4-dioxygenase beta subunit